jgi:F-type H+-transporting ATPase subunit b
MHVVFAISEQGKDLLYPKLSELIMGAIAFFLLLAFMMKWVFPRVNKLLEERQAKIQGDLDKAEEARHGAEQQLAEYRQSLAGARDEATRIIDEARETAEAMRRDLQTKAEQEAQQIVARAQEEIRAERDRVFQELRAQVGVLSVELAGRIVGQELDASRHQRLVDDYIREVASMRGSADGNGHGGDAGA